MAYDITLPVPAVDQFDGATSDGRPSENELEDCGPACVAAVIHYVTGVILHPDEIKDMIWAMDGRASESTGLTSISDLPNFLKERAGIGATWHPVTTVGDAMKVIRQSLFAGRPLIALVQLTSTLAHYVVVHGAVGPDGTHTTTVRYMDPNGGVFAEKSNTDFFDWLAQGVPSRGYRLLISIDTSRNPNLA